MATAFLETASYKEEKDIKQEAGKCVFNWLALVRF